MKIRTLFVAPFAAMLLTPLSANALLTIDPATATTCGTAVCLQAIGFETSQSAIDTAIAGYLGTSTELYKADVDPAQESGGFAGNYTTTFSNTSTDPEDALIEWDGGAYITDATHLLVKDGNHEPAWYLFLIDGVWDGMESISLENFWPNGGAISHVTIYGGGDSTRVPEPGTLGLLGASLISFGLIRRRKSLKAER